MFQKIKWLSIGMVLATVLTISVQSFASITMQSVQVAFDSLSVTVNGKTADAPNILYDGRTYVQMRTISEMLGKDVGWDAVNRIASINDKPQASSSEGVQLFLDDKVKINFLKATSSGVEFMVENKTSKVVTIQADTLAINGMGVSGYISMSDDISPMSKGKAIARCTVELNGTVTKISGQLRVVDSTDYSSYNATFVDVPIQ